MDLKISCSAPIVPTIELVGYTYTSGSTLTSEEMAIHANTEADDWILIFYCNDAGGLETHEPTSTFYDVSLFNSHGSIALSTDAIWWVPSSSTIVTNGYVGIDFNDYLNIGCVTVMTFRGDGLDSNSAFLADEISYEVDTDDTVVINHSNPGTDISVAFAFLDDQLTSVETWPTSYTDVRDQETWGVPGSGGTTAFATAPFNKLPGDPESFIFNSGDLRFGAAVILND